MGKRLGGWLVALVIFVGVALFSIEMDWLGRREVGGQITQTSRAPEINQDDAARQAATRENLGAPLSKQLLFGDFHVHTTFSFDSFLINLPMAGGPGSRPPADACDFARFCSALDFWCINDQAENLTADLWRETVESVSQCNEIAGDPANPDMVTYLGWEWSQIGNTPEAHYGHRNIVLRDTADGAIPTRPIGSVDPTTQSALRPTLGA